MSDIGKPEVQMRVCVGNCGAYANGYLVDEWLGLPMPDWQLNATLNGLREANRAFGAGEEFYVSDVDGNPLGLDISEYASLSSLNVLAKGMTLLDGCQLSMVEAYLSQSNSTMEDALNAILQADELSYMAYTVSGPQFTSVEEKYGYTLVDGDPELSKFLTRSPEVDEAFDRAEYGRICAMGDDVILGDEGAIYGSITYSKYSYEDASATIREQFNDLYPGFEKEPVESAPSVDIRERIERAKQPVTPANGIAIPSMNIQTHGGR